MKQPSLAVLLAVLLAAGPVQARESETIRPNWTGFQDQVAARNLKGRSVYIRLTSGEQIKTSLIDVTAQALTVRPTRGQSSIPKDRIASIRFKGNTGHHGLTGGLIGLGAGAGVGAAIAANSDINEGAFVVILPVIAALIAIGGGVAGYFIGRSTREPLPEFILTP
jgi:hypothetical protein